MSTATLVHAITVPAGTLVSFVTTKPGDHGSIRQDADGTFHCVPAERVTVVGVIRHEFGWARLGNAGVAVELTGEHRGHTAYIGRLHHVAVL